MKKLIWKNSCNNLHPTKLELIDEMTVLISDVSLDSNYMKIYVPVDLMIRNKGNLTLISPKYAFLFSKLLTMITDETKSNSDNTITTKPDKEAIKNKIIYDTNNKLNDNVQTLLNKIKGTQGMVNIDTNVIKQLILDLIERVLNAIVGGQVKMFRTKKLSRANDVTFRTNLKVKCEHGNV